VVLRSKSCKGCKSVNVEGDVLIDIDIDCIEVKLKKVKRHIYTFWDKARINNIL
jgi:hypothetical protein